MTQGMRPFLGPEERTLRWKGRTFWSGCWRPKTSGARATRADALADDPGLRGGGVLRVPARTAHGDPEAGGRNPQPGDNKRGRPGQGVLPAQGIYPIEAALASSIAVPQPLVKQQSGFILATKALDNTPLPPQAL